MARQLFKKRKLFKSDWTPAEKLLLVIILGIIVGLLFTQANDWRARSRDNQRRMDIYLIQHQVEAFYALNGQYPMSLAEVGDLPASACQDPRGGGDCQQPDYKYKAFREGTPVDESVAANCNNQKSGKGCAAFVLYTNRMERSPNPFLVHSN